MEGGYYELPKLKYGYGDLAPNISEEQLKLHHTKHHQTYVDGANNLLKKWETAKKEGAEVNIKADQKEFSFNIGGHTLHTLFWENMAPPGKGGNKPGGALSDAIERDFGSFDRFKKLFSQDATSVEGSGWAALTYDKGIKKLLLMQIEKHNVNVFPQYRILMLVDVWEHAYYLDYKNVRAKFVEAYWNIVNWDWISSRFDKCLV